MKSEISSVLELIKGTAEHDILVEMDNAYVHIEDCQREWFDKSKFTCPEGCGCCCECFEPDILESEALYMAAWLIENQLDVAKMVALGEFPFPDEKHCQFYNPDAKYHCSIYKGRSLICRLFGASGFRSKNGEEVWKPCKFYPMELLAMHNPPIEHRQYSMEEIRQIFGVLPPVMSDLAEAAETFTPNDDKTRLIREILPETIQRLLWIVEMNSKDSAHCWLFFRK